jgi:hypothetical protein
LKGLEQRLYYINHNMFLITRTLAFILLEYINKFSLQNTVISLSFLKIALVLVGINIYLSGSVCGSSIYSLILTFHKKRQYIPKCSILYVLASLHYIIHSPIVK